MNARTKIKSATATTWSWRDVGLDPKTREPIAGQHQVDDQLHPAGSSDESHLSDDAPDHGASSEHLSAPRHSVEDQHMHGGVPGRDQKNAGDQYRSVAPRTVSSVDHPERDALTGFVDTRRGGQTEREYLPKRAAPQNSGSDAGAESQREGEPHFATALGRISRKGAPGLKVPETHEERAGRKTSRGRKQTDAPQARATGDGGGHPPIEAPVAHAPAVRKSRSGRKAGAVVEGQETDDAQQTFAPTTASKSRRQQSVAPRTGDAAGSEVQDHARYETQSRNVLPSPIHSTDPVIAEIVQLHRMRRRWMKARNALILQGKAFGRALASGDKEAGTKIYEQVRDGTCDDPIAIMSISVFISASKNFDEQMDGIEKRLAKLAKKLPVAPWVEGVSGFGFPSLAALVGEAGDIGQYRTVSGLWKRFGLAVIGGERQRRVADKDLALAHGYSPERRSVAWNVAEPMSRRQRTWFDKETGEVKKPADHYGIVLEREKAKALEKGCQPGHAENRARRHMMKAVLRDLWVAWRAAANGTSKPMKNVPPPELIAAE